MTNLILFDLLSDAERDAQRVLDRARGFPEVERRAEVVRQIACILRGVFVTQGDIQILEAQRAAMLQLASVLPAS